jgi:Na+/proline symporter
MTPYAVLITILAYFAAMAIVSWLSGRKKDGQDVFYTGGRKTHWTVVAVAMIGSCMSGVTYVSVPGMVGTSGFGYLQMCIGFFLGYLVIAFVLTPLYFRLDVVSIYQYLEKRFGMGAYRTGAWFFFLSKMLGASVRLFLVCLTLQLLLFDPLGLPFWLNVLCNVGVCLVYTYRSGVKSVIWTDVLKTVCMVVAVTLCVILIGKDLGGIRIHEKVFFFDDVNHPQYFWKQLLGGLFTVVAMTGLDQDMMQRTLSCKDTRDSQKNLVVSSLLQTVVIALFLCLGALLYQFAAAHGIAETGDRLFPAVATSSLLPGIVGVLFVLGLVCSAYGAGGSALTSLTTSFTVDILGKGGDVKVRKAVHIGMAVLMAVTVIVFNALNSTSAIDAVYKLASYTYGPILGLFAFGILTKKAVKDKYVPIVALVAPAICLILQLNSERWFGGYRFSYELLLVNAALSFLGLCLLRKK